MTPQDILFIPNECFGITISCKENVASGLLNQLMKVQQLLLRFLKNKPINIILYWEHLKAIPGA